MTITKIRTTNNASTRSRMRKILPALIALVTLAVSAQPAAAGSPRVTRTTVDAGGSISETCVVDFAYGIHGDYGAWGEYVGGCTADRQCPFDRCTVSVSADIETEEQAGHRVTANARVRTGNAFYDESCEGENSCVIHNEWAYPIYKGEAVSVECNGVYEANVPEAPNFEITEKARPRCSVTMETS